jgi:nucleoside-diphosphate-sugar epimerase
MRVVLTGSKGFVGSNIRTFLQSLGAELYGPVTVTEVIEIGRNTTINWDNFSKAAVEAEVYIHTAGKAHDVKGKSVLQEYMDVNFGLTKVLYDKFLSDNIAKTFIYFSSVKAAASNVEGILKETDRFEIHDAYGLSKRAAEDYILNQALPEGKRIFILRPCMIYGEGHKGNLNLLKKLVHWNIPYPLAAFKNERSFVSIETVVKLVAKIINNELIPSGIYNVADPGYMSTNDWIIKLSKEMGRTPKLWRISPKIIRGLAYLGDYLPLPLNSHRLQKLTENYRVSCEKTMTTF